jgi:hypothetical protein
MKRKLQQVREVEQHSVDEQNAALVKYLLDSGTAKVVAPTEPKE